MLVIKGNENATLKYGMCWWLLKLHHFFPKVNIMYWLGDLWYESVQDEEILVVNKPTGLAVQVRFWNWVGHFNL